VAKILIIDDEPVVLSVLRRNLEAANHEVYELSDGTAALSTQREADPDLVITDLFMPGEDGLQTIMTLRDAAPNLPIIAISGGPRGRAGETCRSMLDAAKTLGASVTLEKPFSREQIYDAVSTALGESSAVQE
jgi:CheY-like chemotaxis protein